MSDLRTRVLSRIEVDLTGPATVDGAPCWYWVRGLEGHGYGRLRARNLTYLAHRVAWELLRGPIPDRTRVGHLCPNPACCNPAHLFLAPLRVVPGETAVLRAARRTALVAQRQSPACPAGHPRTQDGTYLRSNGSRRCRECHNAGQREYRARVKAQR